MNNAAMVQGLYEAAARGEHGVLMGALHPSIEWREAEGTRYAGGNPYVGPDAVGPLLGRIATDVADFRLEPQTFTDGGDVVLVQGRYKGVGANTKKPLDAAFAHIWYLREGKVVQFQQYTDTKQWGDVLEG